MSRRRGSLAGNPLLIGAVTVLIVIVAVYISYNATKGLPFTPTYHVEVRLPTGSDLFPGNEVRIDGTRVGIVEKLVPHQNPKTGRLTASALLKIEKGASPLPVDTKAIVQSVSSVGLKYLLLERGTAKKMIPEGGVIPRSHTRRPVDINEFFDMFDKPTRRANKENLIEFGNGLVGRGQGLSETIAKLRPLVKNLTPVMHTLAEPKTKLKGFWAALDRAAKEAAPVAGAQGELYRDLDTFFAAWAGVSTSLEESIVGGPSAMRLATQSLKLEAPFIRKSAEFMRLLRPSAKALVTVAPPLAHAFKVGAVNFKAATSLNSEIASSSEAVQQFAEDPIVTLALEDLTHTAKLGNPLLAGLAPEQAQCNYIGLLFRNVASLFTEGIGIGTIARASVVLGPPGPNNEVYPASAPANGPSVQLSSSTHEVEDNNHVHYNPYPNVPGGPGAQICEAGNEVYEPGKLEIGHSPKVGSATEATHRNENIWGRPYSKSTLEDLGLAKGSKESEASKGSKGSKGSKSSSGKGGGK